MRRGTGQALALVGLLALAVNLRPAAVSVGPVLAEVEAALRLSAVQSGLLTALPVLTFGAFGALAPGAARLVGLHRLTLVALLAVVGGLGARAAVTSPAWFLLLSALALAGMATSNVLMPALVRLHFPHRIGQVTALYTTSLAVGLTAASSVTVPVADAFGSWRWGIGIWAAVAALAALLWLTMLRHDARPDTAPETVTLRAVARTRLGWALAATFGLQSLQAYTIFGWFAQVYRDAGISAVDAGLLLGVITGVSIPLSLWVPRAAARRKNPARLMLALIVCYPVGYVGLIVAPQEGALAWAVLVGTAASVFPLVLTLISLRSRTPEGAAALSGFTQGVGYLLAAVGPFGAGLLRDLTGGWTATLLTLTAISAVAAWLAMQVCRPGFIEDELPPAGASVSPDG